MTPLIFAAGRNQSVKLIPNLLSFRNVTGHCLNVFFLKNDQNKCKLQESLVTLASMIAEVTIITASVIMKPPYTEPHYS